MNDERHNSGFDVPGPEEAREIRGEQRRLLEQARRHFLERVELLTEQEADERLRRIATGHAPTAKELRRAGRLLAIPINGRLLYPTFQFVEGGPHPAMQEVLAAFRGDSPWSVAMWFASPSGWLGGERPLDLLRTDPGRVIDAARQTSAPLEI